MLRRVGDFLHGRFAEQPGFRDHVNAAQAATHVAAAIAECFPPEAQEEMAFLSYANGCVTVGVTHAAVHETVRENEKKFSAAIARRGTSVHELRVRVIRLPEEQH